MAAHKQTTEFPAPSAPPDFPFEVSDATKILQNQARIMETLNHLTSKLASVCDRLSIVEKKVEVTGGAPPPYTRDESGTVLSRSDETLLNEIRQVQDSVVVNGFFHMGYQKVIIYGLSYKLGENTTEVVKVFLREVLDMPEDEVKTHVSFACRLPRILGGGGNRPPPVIVASPAGASTGSHIIQRFGKKYKELRPMNISARLHHF